MRSGRLWIAALGFLILGAFFVYQTWGRDVVDGHLCAEEYARARSAADSTLIDARAPVRNRGRGELANPIPTCGELRRLGKVR
jgi:hypothetical protein